MLLPRALLAVRKIDQLICSEPKDKILLSAQHRLVVRLAHFVCGKDTAVVLVEFAT